MVFLGWKNRIKVWNIQPNNRCITKKDNTTKCLAVPWSWLSGRWTCDQEVQGWIFRLAGPRRWTSWVDRVATKAGTALLIPDNYPNCTINLYSFFNVNKILQWKHTLTLMLIFVVLCVKITNFSLLTNNLLLYCSALLNIIFPVKLIFWFKLSFLSKQSLVYG